MSYFPEITKDGVRFIVSKISNSRKEIEIRVVSDNVSQYESLQYDFGNGQILSVAKIFNALNTIMNNISSAEDVDVVIPLSDGSYIAVVNHNYFQDTSIPDVTDVNRFNFVLKLNLSLIHI